MDGKASFLISFDNIPNIVVLLILAGITITMIVSDDGIIKYAQKASDMANNVQNKTLEGIDKISNDLSDPYVEIPSNSTGNGTAADIEDYEQLKILGSTVDYVPDDEEAAAMLKTLGVEWQLLYAGNQFSSDGSYHFWLIANRPLEVSQLPSATDPDGTIVEKYPVTGTDTGAGSTRYYGINYSPVESTYVNPADRIDPEVALLDPQFSYKDSLSNSARSALRKSAYFLDLNAWSFLSSSFSDFAIGTPSFPLLCAASNVKYRSGITWNPNEQVVPSFSPSISNIVLSPYEDTLFYANWNIPHSSGQWITCSPSSLMPSESYLDGYALYGNRMIEIGSKRKATNYAVKEFMAGSPRPVIRLKSSCKLEFSLDGSMHLSW